MKIYALFQTDVWRTKQSRIFCGIFSTKQKAVDAAKMNDLYTSHSEVVIIECKVDNFDEQ